LDARDGWGIEGDLSGNPAWRRRQRRTRATTRRGENNGFGTLMKSSSTGMKEVHFTAFAYS